MKRGITLLSLLLIVGLIANAQFGKLKVPKMGKTKKQAPMVYNDKMPVSLDLKYLIEDISVSDESGAVYNNFVKVTFPPLNDAKGPIDYREQSRFWVQLSKGGEVVYKNPYIAQHDKTTYKVFVPNRQGEGYADPEPVTNPAGDYTLSYFLDDSCFYEFPLTINELKSDDPYANVQSKYTVSGFWNDYGFIEIQDDNRVIFNCFLRDENFKPKGSGAYMLWIDVMKGDKVITGDTKEEDKATKKCPTLKNEWSTINRAFLKRDASKKYLELADLEDGDDYKFVVSLDNKLSEYKFAVKDHKIVPQGKQVFSKDDSKHYMEGIGKTFFLKKN